MVDAGATPIRLVRPNGAAEDGEYCGAGYGLPVNHYPDFITPARVNTPRTVPIADEAEFSGATWAPPMPPPLLLEDISSDDEPSDDGPGTRMDGAPAVASGTGVQNRPARAKVAAAAGLPVPPPRGRKGRLGHARGATAVRRDIATGAGRARVLSAARRPEIACVWYVRTILYKRGEEPNVRLSPTSAHSRLPLCLLETFPTSRISVAETQTERLDRA